MLDEKEDQKRTHTAIPLDHCGSKSITSPFKSIAFENVNLASMHDIAIHNEASATCRPTQILYDHKHYQCQMERQIILTNLLPNPKATLTVSSLRLPSSSKKRSGKNCEGLGYFSSFRVIALQSGWPLNYSLDIPTHHTFGIIVAPIEDVRRGVRKRQVSDLWVYNIHHKHRYSPKHAVWLRYP